MANFCTTCGAPVAGRFCTACGASAQAAASPAVTPGTPPPVGPPAAAAGSGSALKIVLIVVAAVVIMGAVGLGSLIYVGYKAKQKITQLARENGIPIDSSGSSSGARVLAPPPNIKPTGSGCTVLSGEEATQILGIAVDRVETISDSSHDLVCQYWISLAERQRLAKAQIAAGISGFSKADPKSEDPDLGDAARIIGGALTALTTASTAGEGDFSISIEITRTGGKRAFETAQTGQDALNAYTAGLLMQNIEGVGDKAIMLAGGQGIGVLKGDTFMYLGFAQLAPGPEKAVALAKKAASRL